jgi:hypothetical protein
VRSGGVLTVSEARELRLVGMTDNSSTKHRWETLFRVPSNEGVKCMLLDRMLSGRGAGIRRSPRRIRS